jgi:hypothetical protein
MLRRAKKVDGSPSREIGLDRLGDFDQRVPECGDTDPANVFVPGALEISTREFLCFDRGKAKACRLETISRSIEFFSGQRAAVDYEDDENSGQNAPGNQQPFQSRRHSIPS